VRFDKRGIGASATLVQREEDIRFDTYVNDLRALAKQVRADKRFGRITLAGHSEGSLISILAAQSGDADGMVSLSGPGRPAATVLREQLASMLSGTLADQAESILKSLEAGETRSDVPSALAQLFRPSVQPYLISWFRYDPAAEFAKLTLDLAVVQGTTDTQVTAADAQLLADANAAATLVMVKGMCHVLKKAGSDAASQSAAYSDPSLPVMPEVFDAIVAVAAP
jgi:hypothetical protein